MHARPLVSFVAWSYGQYSEGAGRAHDGHTTNDENQLTDAGPSVPGGVHPPGDGTDAALQLNCACADGRTDERKTDSCCRPVVDCDE